MDQSTTLGKSEWNSGIILRPPKSAMRIMANLTELIKLLNQLKNGLESVNIRDGSPCNGDSNS